jgi:hypothetical protein
MKDKKYEKALQDFSYAIQLNDQRALGLLGKADCLRFMG